MDQMQTSSAHAAGEGVDDQGIIEALESHQLRGRAAFERDVLTFMMTSWPNADQNGQFGQDRISDQIDALSREEGCETLLPTIARLRAQMNPDRNTVR